MPWESVPSFHLNLPQLLLVLPSPGRFNSLLVPSIFSPWRYLTTVIVTFPSFQIELFKSVMVKHLFQSLNMFCDFLFFFCSISTISNTFILNVTLKLYAVVLV